MGRVKESIFQENHHGVLSHDGSLKVAKTEIKQEILHISEETILVRGRKGGYHIQIHKSMKDYMDFVEEGDFAFVKFRNGKAWFVGFQKNKSVKKGISIEDTESLNNFMTGCDVE